MGKFRYVVNRMWRVFGGELTLRASREEELGQVLNSRWWMGWHPEGEDGRREASFNGEVVFPSGRFALTCTVHERGADDDVGWTACVPPLGLYFSASHRLLRRACDLLLAVPDKAHYTGGRETGVRVFERALWWDLWHTEHCWTSGTPRWRHGSFHPVDWLFGQTKYSPGEEVAREDVEVPMPEGVYYGVCTMREERWTRPRLRWWPTVARRAHIEMAKGQGLPFPGKGENSYDCGEDATGGLTCPARTVEDGVAAIVASVLSSRRRHGGRRWRPEKGPYGTEEVRRREAEKKAAEILFGDEAAFAAEDIRSWAAQEPVPFAPPMEDN